jgi:lysophospholipase L1-like esterase
MKTILCYGDSNTWGIDYTTGGRVPFADRWPNVLQQKLGSEYHVIEEGLNGRTTACDDPFDEYPEAKNGKKSLIPCLRSHYPLDMLIILLGTNDLKVQFFTTVDQIAGNIGELVLMARKELKIRQNRIPEILIVAPVLLGDTIETSPFRAAFGGRKALAPSAALSDKLRQKAESLSCHFIDAGKIVHPNTVDAVHLSKEGHHTLGQILAEQIQTISL